MVITLIYSALAAISIGEVHSGANPNWTYAIQTST